MEKFKFYFLHHFYNLIRPFYVKDWDRREDYYCVNCNKPVLRRDLTCSNKCRVEFNYFMEHFIGYDENDNPILIHQS